MKTRLRRGSLLFGTLVAAQAGCAAHDEPGETVDTLGSAVICGHNDTQNVEQYATEDGISKSLIDRLQGAVGNYGCSGTLIGDGLFLTVAHCDTPSSVTFNDQLDPNGLERPTVSYNVAEVVERSSHDFNIVRLHYAPENRWGFAGVSGTPAEEEDRLILIGHPFQEDHDTLPDGSNHKVVDVGRVNELSTNDIEYRSLDTRGGASGAGVWNSSGRLTGLHRSSGSSEDRDCDLELQGEASKIERIYDNSELMQGSRGSGHLFKSDPIFSGGTSLTQVSTMGNWGSSWHHIVRGNFDDDGYHELFFYDSVDGVARFYDVNSSGTIVRKGDTHSTFKTWSQVIRVQLDDGPDELLAYDARAGSGAFYRTDGAGSLQVIRHNSGWSQSWTTIVAGDFVTSRAGQELLFHDRENNKFAVYGVNTDATITFIKEQASSSDPTIVVAGDFLQPANDPNRAELLAYTGPTKVARVWQFANDGTMTQVASTTLPELYTQMTAGDFTASNGTNDLAFYAPSSGTLVLAAVSSTGTVNTVLTQPGLRKNFGKLASGNFMSGQDGHEILFYDRFRE